MQSSQISSVPHRGRTTSHARPLFASRSLIFLSVLQIILGVLSVVFGIVCILLQAAVASLLGTGIWCGIMFFVTGLVGLFAAAKKSDGLIVAVMVLCILSACAAALLLLLSGPGIAQDVHYIECIECMGRNGMESAKIGVQSFLIAVAIFEAVAAIWASALCCKTVCVQCCSEPGVYSYGTPMQVQYVAGQVGGNHQVLFMPAPGAPSGVYSGIPQGQMGYIMQPGTVLIGVPNQPQIMPGYTGVPQQQPHIQQPAQQAHQMIPPVSVQVDNTTAAATVAEEMRSENIKNQDKERVG